MPLRLHAVANSFSCYCSNSFPLSNDIHLAPSNTFQKMSQKLAPIYIIKFREILRAKYAVPSELACAF